MSVKRNIEALKKELINDPENIGYCDMSDEECAHAMTEHKVSDRLGFFAEQISIFNGEIHSTMITDVIRADHIKRFRE